MRKRQQTAAMCIERRADWRDARAHATLRAARVPARDSRANAVAPMSRRRGAIAQRLDDAMVIALEREHPRRKVGACCASEVTRDPGASQLCVFHPPHEQHDIMPTLSTLGARAIRAEKRRAKLAVDARAAVNGEMPAHNGRQQDLLVCKVAHQFRHKRVNGVIDAHERRARGARIALRPRAVDACQQHAKALFHAAHVAQRRPRIGVQRVGGVHPREDHASLGVEIALQQRPCDHPEIVKVRHVVARHVHRRARARHRDDH
eukprot:IDg18037t1